MRCPQCGAEGKLSKTEENGMVLWCCAHCAGKFTEESTEREYERLESTVKASLGSVVSEAMLNEKTEKYYNLRSMLWDKITAKYIDSRAIVNICREIKGIDPHDFLAEFFEIANSADDIEVADYIGSIDVKENALYLDLVLDFLTRSLKESYVTPVAALLDRAGYVLSPSDKQKHLTEFEKEADKVQGGLYDLNTPRDVFLAYSSRDMKSVVEILNFIEDSGLTCFAAFRNLQHGRDAVASYERALQTAIDNSSIFVFLSSVNSRNQSCDAFKREIPYVRQRDLQKYPEARTYAQLPDRYKMLKVEYRLDNRPTPIADRMLKDFFSGLTYAETFDQLIDRLGECMDVLNSPVVDEEAERLAEETRRREEAERRLREIEDADRLRRAEEAERRLREMEEAERARKAEETRKAEDARLAEETRRREEAERKLREMEEAEKTRKAEEARRAEATRRANTSTSTYNAPVERKTYSDGAVYVGQLKDGKRHGKGKCTFASGNYYDGDWKDDCENGKGFFSWTSGDTFEGDFVSNKRNGKGIYRWANGNSYDGDWKDGNRTGYGKYYWAEGDFFEGYYLNNLRHGNGRMTWKSGDVYDGAWKDDKRHGKGRYVWGEGKWKGESYYGDWLEGARTGQGKYIWKDGGSYEGGFLNGKLHGTGIYTYPDGRRETRTYDNDKLISSSKSTSSNSSAPIQKKTYNNGVYEGQFLNDKRHGRGKYTFQSGEVYDGEWRDGDRNGYGKCRWANGNSYEGDWKGNMRTGRGKFFWADGSVYEGDYLNNNRHGSGRMTWKNGDVYDGTWKDDNRDGKGSYHWGEGKWKGESYYGDWKNGARTGQGKYIWKDGSSYEGGFLNSQLHGNGVYIYPNGKKEARVYDNGKLISSKKKLF